MQLFLLMTVRSSSPKFNRFLQQIKCLRFPSHDEQAAYEFLEELRDLFGKQEILDEDNIRVSSVRSGNQFQQQAKAEPARPLETFLAELDAELSLSPVAAGDARAFELVNKTNQFNLNGKRLSESEFQTALNRPGAVSFSFPTRTNMDRWAKLRSRLAKSLARC